MTAAEQAVPIDLLTEIRGHRLPASLEFWVAHAPAPQGSKVPKGRAGNGRIVMAESSKYVEPWREAVKLAAQRAAGVDAMGTLEDRFPLDGPLVAYMVFTMPKPKAAPKRRRTYPASHRNDVSKLARSTEDAMMDAGVISDDGMIIEYTRLAKVFPNEDDGALGFPGAVIRLWSLDELASVSR